MLPRTLLRHVQILVLLVVVAAQELLDLYVHERFIKFPVVEDESSGGGCEKCKVTDVCAPVRTFAIQSACMQTIGSEGSHLWEGNDETICVKSYSNNQECYDDEPLLAANNNPSDPIIISCDHGHTPNVCVEGAEEVDGWKAATQFTRLIDYCVESSESSTIVVEDFIVPMIEVRTFPTLEQCQEQNNNYEQIYLPVDPNLCTTSTIEINQRGYPGSVRLTCDDQNFLVQESYSDLGCSKQDTELLDNPILRISSSECTQNSLDGGHGTEYRRAYCTSPTYYCKSLYDTEFGVNVLVENSTDDNASIDEDPDNESFAASPYSCVSTAMLSCLAALLSLILL